MSTQLFDTIYASFWNVYLIPCIHMTFMMYLEQNAKF